VWGDGNYIYAACLEDGVRAYSFDGNTFTLIDTHHQGGEYQDVWGDGTYIYTACGEDGIRAYSFDGNTFTLIDTRYDKSDKAPHLDIQYYEVWGDGTYVYAACDRGGIRAYLLEDSTKEEGNLNDTPGFETIILLVSLSIFLFFKKRRR